METQCECSVCQQAFAHSVDLENHMISHTESNLNKIELCHTSSACIDGDLKSSANIDTGENSEEYPNMFLSSTDKQLACASHNRCSIFNEDGKRFDRK